MWACGALHPHKESESLTLPSEEHCMYVPVRVWGLGIFSFVQGVRFIEAREDQSHHVYLASRVMTTG